MNDLVSQPAGQGMGIDWITPDAERDGRHTPLCLRDKPLRDNDLSLFTCRIRLRGHLHVTRNANTH
ncbi:MAG: hypothetical protein KDA87_03865 [Planctomycetales bacterium]|nr:hypothetical protein [Planctomycetales bacterium]